MTTDRRVSRVFFLSGFTERAGSAAMMAHDGCDAIRKLFALFFYKQAGTGGVRPTMIHIVLFQPEIPQNTGNVGRMCALTGSRLHLIHPLGFRINDRNLRRAGMDYWRSLDVHEHADWKAFRASDSAPRRLWLFTTQAARGFWDAKFEDGDGLVF